MSEIEKIKLLNKAQVNELFQRCAIQVGTTDGVPDFVAVALFGRE